MASKLFRPILIGGLIAGALDITCAFVFSYIRSGRTPLFILQSVASGAGGRMKLNRQSDALKSLDNRNE